MVDIVHMCVEKTFTKKFSVKEQPIASRKYSPQHAAFVSDKLWPPGTTIKVAFMSDGEGVSRTSSQRILNIADDSGNKLKPDPLQRKVDGMSIQEAVRKIVSERIVPIVGIKIVFVDDVTDADIRISFEESSGAWSLIGTDCLNESDVTKATMNLGWFDVATTIHEFGHALGMIHEHQNPEGNKIEWDKQKVFEWAKSTQGWDKETATHNIIDRYDADSINGSEYDPLSIMLYFFPDNLTLNGKGTQQNLRLSAYDVKYLTLMYPGSPETAEYFYRKVYGEKLTDASEETIRKVMTSRGSPVWLYIVITVLSAASVGIIYIVVSLIKRGRK